MKVNVGSNGEFNTLNEAILSVKDTNENVTINLLNDYVMKEQIFVYNENLKHITISANQEVIIDTNYLVEEVRVISNPQYDVLPAFYGYRSAMPVIDVLFKVQLPPSVYDPVDSIKRQATGFLLDNSTMVIKAYKGCTDSPFINLCLINESFVQADYGIFDRGGNRNILDKNNIEKAYGDGVRVNNSRFQGSHSTAHDCGDIGFHFTGGASGNINNATSVGTGHHCLQVTSSSNVSARHGVFTDCIDDCVTVYAGSSLDLRYGDVSRAEVNYGLIVTRSSYCNFEGGVANNCGYSGIMANRGSTIDATNSQSNHNRVDGVRCANSSMVDFTGGGCNGSLQDGIHCTHGSVVQARESKITGSGRDGILAYSSQVYADNCEVTNSARYNVIATRGGYISVNDSDLSKAGSIGVLAYGGDIFANYCTVSNITGRGFEATQGGTIKAYDVSVSGNSDNDFAVYNGGIIYASGSNGSANREVNQITTHGIILV